MVRDMQSKWEAFFNIKSFTDVLWGWKRWWIQRNPLVSLGIRPSSKEIKGYSCMAKIIYLDLNLFWSFCIIIWRFNGTEVRFFKWIKQDRSSYSNK